MTRTPRNTGLLHASWGLTSQPGHPVKNGVNSEDDPIRTDNLVDGRGGGLCHILDSSTKLISLQFFCQSLQEAAWPMMRTCQLHAC